MFKAWKDGDEKNKRVEKESETPIAPSVETKNISDGSLKPVVHVILKGALLLISNF